MDLLKKTDYDSKITETESKIPSISASATNSALTAVKTKIPDVSNLVEKTDYNTKISEIEKKVIDYDHDKYIPTSEFNKLTTKNLIARLAQVNLVTKTGFNAKLTGLEKEKKDLLKQNKALICEKLTQKITNI